MPGEDAQLLGPLELQEEWPRREDVVTSYLGKIRHPLNRGWDESASHQANAPTQQGIRLGLRRGN